MKTKQFLFTLAAAGLFTARLLADVSVDTVATNGLHEPCSVTADPDGNFFVADSVNNRIARLDATTFAVTTVSGQYGMSGTNDGPVYLASFYSPQAVLYAAISGVNGLVVADTGNHSIRFVNLTNGAVTTLAGGTGTFGVAVPGPVAGSAARFRNPVGLSLDSAKNLYIADSGNNCIRVLNLTDPTFAVSTVSVPNTTFFQPNAVAVGDANQLWVADTRRHAVKRITLSSVAAGTMTVRIGSDNQSQSGTTDSIYGANARFNGPRGLLWLGNGTLLISDTGNHSIRIATNYAVLGATNYAVGIFVGASGTNGFVNGTGSAVRFNSPFGISADPFGNDFLIADQANNAVRRIQSGPVLPPVTTPIIGWVDLVKDGNGSYVTLLRSGSSFVFNNDAVIAILAEQATETYYTVGSNTTILVDNVPTPGRLNGQTPPVYVDGAPASERASAAIETAGNSYSFTVKAIGLQTGRRPSSISQASFTFITANPQIVGDNAAQFSVFLFPG